MNEYTRLQQAVLSNDILVVSQTLDSVSDVNITGGSDINVLHYYISMADRLNYDVNEIVKLMNSKGVNINAQNDKGASPLHFCVARSNSEIARCLLDRGASVDIQDEMGNTPLWRAVMNFRGEKNLLEVIKLLVERGGNPDKENNSGNSPRKIVLQSHRDIPVIGDPIEWDLQPHLNW